MAEIIDEFRNLSLDKDAYYEFFDGFVGAIEDQHDPLEDERLNTFFKANNYGINIAYNYLFEDLDLSSGQENLLKLTFQNLCEYFDADPNGDEFEDLADVVSSGS